MPSLFADLQFRGLVHQMSDPSLAAKLDGGGLVAYIGFDPTSDSLHVGSLLQLCLLKRLQEGGHQPIALAGGGTGMIGDPSGKSQERPLLEPEELDANVAGIRAQLSRFLDFSPNSSTTRALLLDNRVWLEPLGLISFLRDIGKHFTVNQMISKESVRARLERPETGVSFTEFSYMLLQAYDFLYLFDHYNCRLQLGASDQWGNITMGIDLIRRVREATAWGLTTPLVVKPDGSKFGKTESGVVWLDPSKTSPYQFYQFFLRTEDSVVGTYLRYFTFLDHEEILALEESVKSHPERREAQRVLAREVCTLVHGDSATHQAEMASQALFSTEVDQLEEETLLEVFKEAPSTTLPKSFLDGSPSMSDAFVLTGLAPSKKMARTVISQGGGYLNNRRVTDSSRPLGPGDLLCGRYMILRKGRKEHHLIRFES
ncbi:MAG: tyrosine--tRNA ligase [Actinobacteria bacterium]|jgi:tyrosyl-tRNA synthetase|nr:tyrosine--tRNA ligase [Actinomycetota bacterium]MCL6094470.1 tyrosine--tRNA ligase [Actinomycetota bacterium]